MTFNGIFLLKITKNHPNLQRGDFCIVLKMNN